MTTLRVLSYNIHKGFNSGNFKFVLREVRDTIQNVQADLVLLQEVLGHHRRHEKNIKNWPTSSQFEFLADKIWPHYAYGKNAVYNSGHHGNAILSKYPFTFWENIDISGNRLEKRGLLHGIIKVPGHGELHVICLHLALFEAWRKNQIDQLCERIRSHVPEGAPLVVAGDFNDWRQRAHEQLSESLGLTEVFLEANGSHARSFPSWLPILKLDRVYCRSLAIKEAICLTAGPWKKLSDHAALCVDLEF
jgi:endonuclease/exonuclease/phosphatase family metal-dependent hydrolase